MFVKLDNYIFNGDFNIYEIKLYILLLLNRISFSDTVITNIKLLNKIFGYKDKAKYINKIKKILTFLKETGIIDTDVSLSDIKKTDNLTIKIEDLSDEGMGFTKIEKEDIELTKNFKTNEFVLYFLIKRYYNEKLGKAFISYREMEERIGITNKTSQKIINKFCDMGIIEKYNPNFVFYQYGEIRRSNNEYRNFNNKPKKNECYGTLIKMEDVGESIYNRLKESGEYIEVPHNSYLGFGANRKVISTTKFLIPKTKVS